MLFWTCIIRILQPVYSFGKIIVGPFTLAKTKISKNLGFLYATVYTARKGAIGIQGFWHVLCACAKNPESHTDVLVSGAH